MNEERPEPYAIALQAVIYEANKLGYDINAICNAAKAGLLDGGKPYRSGSANWVAPAHDAIDGVLKSIGE